MGEDSHAENNPDISRKVLAREVQNNAYTIHQGAHQDQALYH